MNAHEIDYHIYGEEMQYVEIELDPQEAVVAEAGSFMMMDQDIKMDTIFTVRYRGIKKSSIWNVIIKSF